MRRVIWDGEGLLLGRPAGRQAATVLQVAVRVVEVLRGKAAVAGLHPGGGVVAGGGGGGEGVLWGVAVGVRRGAELQGLRRGAGSLKADVGR